MALSIFFPEVRAAKRRRTVLLWPTLAQDCVLCHISCVFFPKKYHLCSFIIKLTSTINTSKVSL